MDSTTLLKHIAVVPDSASVRFGEVSKVAAALQRQVQGQLSPIWGINATVDAFETLEDVPIDYWPMIIRDDIHVPLAAGIHQDNNGQPFALVQYSNMWSLTASHEVLEMLVNPFGNRVKAGPSPMPNQGRVNFLVEICDVSQDPEYAYTINGITVSDFYTPNYFDSLPARGVRYCWTGAIEQPRQVLPGGFISWHDPVSDEWFQQFFFDGEQEIRSLGKLTMSQGSIRNAIYALTPRAKARRQGDPALLMHAATASANESKAGSAKAASIREQVARLLAKA